MKMNETLNYRSVLIVLDKSFPINTKMTGFRPFEDISVGFYLDNSSLSNKSVESMLLRTA